jgi:hypothetical protein
VVVAVAKKEEKFHQEENLIYSLLRKKKKPFIFNRMKKINDHLWFYLPHSLLLLAGSLLRLVR